MRPGPVIFGVVGCVGVALAAIGQLPGMGAIGSSVRAASVHRHEGEEWNVWSETNMRVYGVSNSEFDETTGNPVDTDGQMFFIPRHANFVIDTVKPSVDGNDGWYYAEIERGWKDSNRVRGWVRASDLDRSDAEYTKTFPQQQQAPVGIPLNEMRESAEASIAKEAKVTTDAYRKGMEAEYRALNSYPPAIKAGEECSASTASGDAIYVPLHSGPSTGSPLKGFLDNFAHINLKSRTGDGWWLVSVHVKDGSTVDGYVTEWFVDDCQPATAYSKVVTFNLRPADLAQ